MIISKRDRVCGELRECLKLCENTGCRRLAVETSMAFLRLKHVEVKVWKDK